MHMTLKYDVPTWVHVAMTMQYYSHQKLSNQSAVSPYDLMLKLSVCLFKSRCETQQWSLFVLGS